MKMVGLSLGSWIIVRGESMSSVAFMLVCLYQKVVVIQSSSCAVGKDKAHLLEARHCWPAPIVGLLRE
jgi:hypothetical protein